MVRIMRVSDGTEIGIFEEARYIRKAKNGCYVQCEKKDAEGVAAGGEAYSLVGKDQLDDKEFVFVGQVDAGALAMQTERNATDGADLLDLSVDHEYRLTMLELGVN